MGTSATTAFPGITFEVALGTGAKTAASSWTDWTTRVRSIDVNVGRDRELDQFRTGSLDVVVDGTDRLLDPEYSAGTYFGQLVPMVQARLRAVYASVTYDLFYGYIQGWPQAYPGYDADLLVNLKILDGFSVLAAARLPDSVWELVVRTLTPAAWYRLGEERGQVMGDASGNGHHGTYAAPVTGTEAGILPYSGADGAKLFDGIDDVGVASVAVINDGDFTVACWIQVPDEIPTDLPTTVARCDPGYFATSGAGRSRMWNLGIRTDGYLKFQVYGSILFFPDLPLSNDAMVPGRTYFVLCTYDTSSGTHELYLDGVLQSNSTTTFDTDWISYVKGTLFVGGLASATEHSWSGVLDEFLTFASVLTAGDVADLYEAGAAPWEGNTSGERLTNILDAVGWPASLRDIDAGTSVLGPATLGGKAFDYIQKIGETEAGLLHCTGAGAVRLVGRSNLKTESTFNTSGATFGDSGAEMKYHDITVDPANVQHLTNVARVSRQGGIEQLYEDTTSSDAYGEREVTLSGLLMAGDGEAYDRAIWLVLGRKDPQFRVDELVITPGRDAANLWPKVLGYVPGQRITVNRRPQGIGSAISEAVHIESITHAVTASTRLWTTTWRLSPVDPNEASWAVVGSGAARNRVGTAIASY